MPVGSLRTFVATDTLLAFRVVNDWCRASTVGGKVVAFEIEDRETPFGTMPLGHSTFVVDERDAKAAGTTIDNIIKMLEKNGATLRKRRKSVKYTPPLYD